MEFIDRIKRLFSKKQVSAEIKPTTEEKIIGKEEKKAYSYLVQIATGLDKIENHAWNKQNLGTIKLRINELKEKFDEEVKKKLPLIKNPKVLALYRSVDARLKLAIKNIGTKKTSPRVTTVKK